MHAGEVKMGVLEGVTRGPSTSFTLPVLDKWGKGRRGVVIKQFHNQTWRHIAQTTDKPKTPIYTVVYKKLDL